MSEKLSDRVRSYLKNKSFQSRPVECFIEDFIVEVAALEQKLAEAEKELTLLREQDQLGGKAYLVVVESLRNVEQKLAERDALIGSLRTTLEECGLVLALETIRCCINYGSRSLDDHEARCVRRNIRDAMSASAPEPAAPEGALTEGGAR